MPSSTCLTCTRGWDPTAPRHPRTPHQLPPPPAPLASRLQGRLLPPPRRAPAPRPLLDRARLRPRRHLHLQAARALRCVRLAGWQAAGGFAPCPSAAATLKGFIRERLLSAASRDACPLPRTHTRPQARAAARRRCWRRRARCSTTWWCTSKRRTRWAAERLALHRLALVGPGSRDLVLPAQQSCIPHSQAQQKCSHLHPPHAADGAGVYARQRL